MEKVTMKYKWLALAFLALSVSIIVMDGTVVNVAIPSIMKDLSLSFTNIEWITTIYTLVLSSLLITCGRIIDHFGRKKALITGIIVFILSSVLASVSKSLTPLIIARVFQGLGAAIIMPATLSSANSLFFGRDRIIAFAVWGAMIAGMAAVGPLVGGYITQYLSWPWIFWINVPIGIAIAIGILAFVPENYGEKMTLGFDFVGFVLSTLAFGSGVFALIEGRNYGWWLPEDGAVSIFGLSIIPLLILASVLLLTFFIMWEKHRANTGKSILLDLNLFKLKSFSIGNIVVLMLTAGEFGLLFVLPLLFQNILGFDALKAGQILAFMGVGAFLSGAMSANLAKKISPINVARIGLFFEAVSLFVMSIIALFGPKDAFGHVVSINTNILIWGLIFYGVGVGMASSQMTSIVLFDVPVEKSGQGSATQTTTRQLGASIGVALIGTVLVTLLSVNLAGAFKNTVVPEPVAQKLETVMIKSAGSSIKSITDSEDFKRLPEDQVDLIKSNINGGFIKASLDTMLISSGLLFVAFLLTFGVRIKATEKDVEKQEEVKEEVVG